MPEKFPTPLEADKAADAVVRCYERTQELLPLAGGVPRPIEESTDHAAVLARAWLGGARWWDEAHPPTEPGVYYWESCDQYGRPSAGLYVWEEGKPYPLPAAPFKFFGPIRGAMRPWPMNVAPEKESTGA